ncbi:MAG: hypothetical protein P4N24_14420 [Acidobacteriota bacterium]|nr:hypothetical protein [Acidobacteriota bacterium]
MSVTRRGFCKSVISVPGTVALWVDALPGSNPVAATESASPVNYMLRYFIRSESASQQTDGLIAYCKENRISHVILFSGNHWDMGWNLPTLEEAEGRVGILRPVFSRLRAAGLHTSINMWTTLGHADIDRDERSRFSWQFMVGDDGAQSRAVPCPIDPQWKAYIGRLYGLFAQLEPEIIYLDDDFRYHNHSPVSWGCFCPLHLEEMARRTGRRLTREELVHQILRAWPQPTAERKGWLDLCGDSILEAARIISTAVKAASAKTHMGLMCSDPNTHAAEGRRWLDMVQAFSVSGNQPVLRPHYASYQEGVYTETPHEIACMRKLQPLLGGRMRLTPELENGLSTRFAKSARLTRLQIALSLFLAPPDITLDIFSFVDTRFDYDTAFDQVLRDSFDYFRGICAWSAECETERGLQILWDQRFPLHRKVESDRMTALPAPRVWEGAMDLMGFATTFYPDDVKLASRAYLEERTQDELLALLQGKLLLDGDAAAFLVEKGFASALGLKDLQPLSGAYNYERMVDGRFADRYADQDETIAGATKYRLDPLENTVIVSRICPPDSGSSLPGMTLFENPLGGRVGVIPLNGSRGDLCAVSFRGWKRQQVLRKMLEWINKGPLPLFVDGGANVLPLRRDSQNAVIIGIANLTPDTLSQIAFRVPAMAGTPRLEILMSQEPVVHQVEHEDGYWRFQVAMKVQPLDLVCFKIT